MDQKKVFENYSKEVECDYKKHHYSVRDNGAIMRHEQGAVGEWSFGDLRANGKPHYKGVNVERIVATAFHGAVSDDYSVVDHIDGNLENNRPENLRWLSPLEDILDNPETIKAINDLCGGFDSFLTAPSRLASLGNRYDQFWYLSREAIEEAIDHLVEMSAIAPLRTGDFYLKRTITSEPRENTSLKLLDDTALMSAWASLVATFKDKPRLSMLLKTCRKEWGRNDDDVFLTFYTKNEIQANWIREKLLPEIKNILTTKLSIPSLIIKVENE